MTTEDTGERIEERRLDRGETLIGFAKRARMGKGHLSEIERGIKSPTVRTLRRIARELNCSPGDLV